MTPHPIRISGNPGATGFILEVEGTDVKDGVSAADLRLRPGEIPELKLDVAAFEVEVDGEARVILPDATRETLVKLGWTPPPGDGQA